MDKQNLGLVALVVGVLLLGLAVGSVLKSSSVQEFNNINPSQGNVEETLGAGVRKPIYYAYDFLGGLFANGTEIVNTSGNFAVPGTLTVTGETSLVADLNVDVNNTTSTISVGNTGVGKLCLYNGSNYTILEYGSNTTTATMSTSTSCQ